MEDEYQIARRRKALIEVFTEWGLPTSADLVEAFYMVLEDRGHGRVRSWRDEELAGILGILSEELEDWRGRIYESGYRFCVPLTREELKLGTFHGGIPCLRPPGGEDEKNVS